MKNKLLKLLCLTLAVLILLSFVGCKKNDNPTISDEDTQSSLNKLNENQQISSENIESQLAAGSSTLVIPGEDRPNVSEMFADATKVYTDIENGTIGIDNTAPIQQIASETGYHIFHLVNDDRFHTYADFIYYLNNLFTESVINQFCDLNCFADNDDGLLCARLGADGINELYAGHTFTVTENSDTVIKFTATVYNYKDYNDIPEDNFFFYSTPENPGKYDVTTINYTLSKQDNGKWLFSEFSPIF